MRKKINLKFINSEHAKLENCKNFMSKKLFNEILHFCCLLFLIC
ncbi:hypothetical protein QR98_0042700 [Sarcoptes scabiei]|uniref:Uncharacterized protein n=1 Tax=Sarcoptes scabiei TaxID=52283 RepID=A0A132A4A0_SARSC|nr:hypothetical protein QR98_0042700 [Sarcoptes scabiei]